jgi:hypothetical protein
MQGCAEAHFGHAHTRFVEAPVRAVQLDLDFMVVSVMRCSIRLALGCMGVVAGLRGWCDEAWPSADDKWVVDTSRRPMHWAHMAQAMLDAMWITLTGKQPRFSVQARTRRVAKKFSGKECRSEGRSAQETDH